MNKILCVCPTFIFGRQKRHILYVRSFGEYGIRNTQNATLLFNHPVLSATKIHIISCGANVCLIKLFLFQII